MTVLVDFIPGCVSTVIPVYNRTAFLREAVESVLAQTYRPIEIIIVDDGSTDDTPLLIHALASAHPNEIKALRKDNGGVALAREAGRCVARGEFIQYLDSDDRLLPEKFAAEVAALRNHPECGIAYGVTRLIDEDGQLLQSPYRWTARGYESLMPALLIDRWWSTHTPLFRRSVCDAVGPWSPMRMAEDWEYEARVAALDVRLVGCPEPLSETRQHVRGRLTGHPDLLAHSSDMARLMTALDRAARAAKVSMDSPEMLHFSRWAFMEARRAGAAALPEASRVCLEVAERASGGRWNLQFKAYRIAVALVGWQLVG
ncbi:MAG: glycosyltransferase family A protein, partial [Pseudomonadota bacterium]